MHRTKLRSVRSSSRACASSLAVRFPASHCCLSFDRLGAQWDGRVRVRPFRRTTSTLHIRLWTAPSRATASWTESMCSHSGCLTVQTFVSWRHATIMLLALLCRRISLRLTLVMTMSQSGKRPCKSCRVLPTRPANATSQMGWNLPWRMVRRPNLARAVVPPGPTWTLTRCRRRLTRWSWRRRSRLRRGRTPRSRPARPQKCGLPLRRRTPSQRTTS
mmetsp:Transcript_3131/g.8907  ORF Transcript_3131/g.8907 Transcript_3131/m.8907 type:complete len:217 (+) Transcript_3131:1321-1971(+)